MPSVSKKQHNLMAMVANDPAAAKRLGIKQSVGKEFMQADKGRKFRGGGMAKDPRDANIFTADKGIQPPSPDEGPTRTKVESQKSRASKADANIFTADKGIKPPKNDDMGSIKKYKSGGKVRGCGCAVKGKTKGTIR
jgi:hypothetical protein